MRWSALALIIATIGGGGLLMFDALSHGKLVSNFPRLLNSETADAHAALEARIARAKKRAENVKGVYMTSIVANDNSKPATHLRNEIVRLLDETELNALVIDVKETEGGLVLTERLRTFVHELQSKGIWVIARLVVFKDTSQETTHPEWYLRRANGRIWRDHRGGSWLDPASSEVWAYQLDAAKRAADIGFDEIQFDYIRFPSDGDLKDLVYPIYDERTPKYAVLRDFFAYLKHGLKSHRPDLIISADLFGYVALQYQDLGIGQRLQDIGDNFDYVSLMVYPSHYYAGFQVSADLARGLPALYYPYQDTNPENIAVAHPYEVVHRSMLIAADALAGRIPTTTPRSQTATTSPSAHSRDETVQPHAKLRPWLQDFNLGIDTARGITYDATRVRAQIDAAEAAGTLGWLLWNSENVYTAAALKPE